MIGVPVLLEIEPSVVSLYFFSFSFRTAWERTMLRVGEVTLQVRCAVFFVARASVLAQTYSKESMQRILCRREIGGSRHVGSMKIVQRRSDPTLGLGVVVFVLTAPA